MSIALSFFILAPLLAQKTDSSSTRDSFASGSVTELFIGRASGAQVVYFRLDRGTVGEASPREAPLGLGRWIRTPGRGFGEHRSEVELQFFEAETRLSHVETMLPGTRKLLWREVRPQGGRTLMLSGAASSGFTVVDSTQGGVHRSSLGGARGLLPLELVESVRRGQTYMGTFPIFQPLGGRFEELQVFTEDSRDENGYAVVELRLSEDDGTLRADYRFRRGELVEFGWRADGPRARRISATEHAHWQALFAPPQDPKDDASERSHRSSSTPTVEGPNSPRR
jgi:hypothetical protein